jgi:hypothetical protein
MTAVPNPESLFIAGCIGSLASTLLSWHMPRKQQGDQAEMLRTILRMLLGGYVAAFVLQPNSTSYAFMVGLILDKALATMRMSAVRYLGAMYLKPSQAVNPARIRNGNGSRRENGA